MQGTQINAAFVSTNSISQGEQVAILWRDLFEQHNVEITFAHRSFVWTSEAVEKAAVHCVIIGFSCYHQRMKYLFNFIVNEISRTHKPFQKMHLSWVGGDKFLIFFFAVNQVATIYWFWYYDFKCPYGLDANRM